MGLWAGANSSPHSICLTHLSVVCTQLGKPEEARDVSKRALVINQQSGSEDDVATSMKHLGYAYNNLREYASAQRHLEDAFACFERTQGPQGSDVTNIRTDLADLAEIIATPSQEIEELDLRFLPGPRQASLPRQSGWSAACRQRLGA